MAKLLDNFSIFFLSGLALIVGIPTLWLFFHRSEYIWTTNTIVVLILLPVAYLCLVIASFFSNNAMRSNLTIVTLSCAVTLYLAEFMLILAGPYITLPRDFDRRTKLQVVLDLRHQGQSAFPSVHPKNILPSSLKVKEDQIVPLSGISHVTTVFCNEVGRYYIYDSDEYGFTNPTGLYSYPLDVALIGDSFTQGFCAPFGTSYADRIRSQIPHTLNFGQNGNGPLLELATLREYVQPMHPHYVIWFYFEGNDVEDLSREIEHPILRQYLNDPKFSQHLLERAPDCDNALRQFVEENITKEIDSHSFEQFFGEFSEQLHLWTRLWHVRALLGITDLKREWKLHRWNSNVTEESVLSAFHQVLQESKSLVESWGGKLIVLYLPSYRTYGYEVSHPWRSKVLEEFAKSKIEVIDLLPIFQKDPDPFSFFNYRKEGHYTEKGNELVAQVVLSYLQKQNFPIGAYGLQYASGNMESMTK